MWRFVFMHRGPIGCQLLVFLPKEPSIKTDTCSYYAAKDTRPLSVVNTDNCISADALRDRLARLASRRCNPSQRGSFQTAVCWTTLSIIDFECRKAYTQGRRGVLVLVDFI